MERLLIVEENTEYIDFLSDLLEEAGYLVDSTTSLIEGFQYLEQNKYDMLISDIDKQSLKTEDLIKVARALDSQIRVLILSSTSTDEGELCALKLGADFYLMRDRDPEIILLYIQKLLENKQTEIVRGVQDLYSRTEGIIMNLDTHQVYKKDVLIALSPKEFGVLQIFLENKSSVLTRKDIVDRVWRFEALSDTSRIVDVHIQKLREKLDIYAIMTVRGIGYKWNE